MVGSLRLMERSALLISAGCALILTSVGAAPPGPPNRDPRPILTSLGITREDGRPIGVVGGRERFRLQAPPGKSFQKVVWKIEGTIGKSEPRINQNPLVTPLPDPLVVVMPAGSTESILEFHWDGSGGKHSIQVMAFYTDGSTGTPDGFSPPLKD